MRDGSPTQAVERRRLRHVEADDFYARKMIRREREVRRTLHRNRPTATCRRRKGIAGHARDKLGRVG